MTILRMPLCGLSLCVVMLLWPPSSLAGPEKAISALASLCKQEMERIYKHVELDELMDVTTNETRKASVSGSVQKFIEKSLPQFKEKCGTLEANSVANLENGKYLRDLAAAREKEKKAFRHVKAAGHVSDSELMQDLSLEQ